MTLFRDKYRIESARLPTWDYSEAGWYFVTICTHHRQCTLGSVSQGLVCPSGIGQAAQRQWEAIPSHYEDVSLDAFVLMPNHLHGIVILGERHRLQSW